MNKRLLLAAGGAILVAGGVAFWYLQQKPPPPPPPPPNCSDYTSKSECLAAGCYWYNNACHSTPPGDEHGCRGDCFYEDATDCDRDNNLCKCINGEWQLLERNSPKCLSGIKHNECFPSQNNIVTCIPVPGIGTDLCEDMGFSKGCPCYPPQIICDIFHFCDQRVHRCIQEAAGLNISADNTNWEKCFSTKKPFCSPCCDAWDYSGYTCDFDLDDEWAGSTLAGQIGYEWTTPISGISTNIYGYIDGVGWSYLGHHHAIGEGPHQVLLNFAKQGVSKLRFASCSTYWVNSKPKYFYGILS